MILHSENFGGNLHEATDYINKMGLADYVLVMSCPTGFSTVVVFRMERTQLAYFKDQKILR